MGTILSAIMDESKEKGSRGLGYRRIRKNIQQNKNAFCDEITWLCHYVIVYLQYERDK